MTRIYLVILIVMGIILLFGWIISSIQESIEALQKRKEKTKEIKKKWGDRSNRLGSLEERNDDIIEGHLKKLRLNHGQYYYIENSVRDCIQEITEAESNLEMAPNYSYLSQWKERANQEYLSLMNGLLKKFGERYKDLEQKEIQKENEMTLQHFNDLRKKYSDLISQFNEVAYRKVSIIDEYGQENWDALPKEIDVLIGKIARGENKTEKEIKDWKRYSFSLPNEYALLRDYLEKSFKRYHAEQKKIATETTNYADMGGVEFENYLARLLKENSFKEISRTPTTGDQGADLITKRDGKKIIIQAKRYDGSVGNKAVQEVIAALGFYGGDEGWVVTNSTFTKSARELAYKTGIRLIDGNDLSRFSSLFK